MTSVSKLQRVVDFRKDGYDIYIGAVGPEAGAWSNPFKLKKSVKAWLEKYERHVRNSPYLMEHLSELAGKTLGVDERLPPGGLTVNHKYVCHGQVLLKLLTKSRQAKRAKTSNNKSMAAWLAGGGDTCEVCGMKAHPKIDPKTGEQKVGKSVNGKPGRPIWVRLNQHHILSRAHYPELKFEPLNRVTLCPGCHKHSRFSAHENPVHFVLWLRRHKLESYLWCRQHVGHHPKDPDQRPWHMAKN